MRGLNDFRRLIETSLRPLRQRIMSMVTRGVLESVDDSVGIQKMKVSLLAEEVLSGVERIQQYGMSSRPPKGSELVCVFMGGNRENGFVLGVESREDRPKDLIDGEVRIYTSGSSTITLTPDGKIEIKNDTADLVAQVSEIANMLVSEPFIVNKATASLIKTKVDSLKK